MEAYFEINALSSKMSVLIADGTRSDNKIFVSISYYTNVCLSNLATIGIVVCELLDKLYIFE